MSSRFGGPDPYAFRLHAGAIKDKYSAISDTITDVGGIVAGGVKQYNKKKNLQGITIPESYLPEGMDIEGTGKDGAVTAWDFRNLGDTVAGLTMMKNLTTANLENEKLKNNILNQGVGVQWTQGAGPRKTDAQVLEDKLKVFTSLSGISVDTEWVEGTGPSRTARRDSSFNPLAKTSVEGLIPRDKPDPVSDAPASEAVASRRGSLPAPKGSAPVSDAPASEAVAKEEPSVAPEVAMATEQSSNDEMVEEVLTRRADAKSVKASPTEDKDAKKLADNEHVLKADEDIFQIALDYKVELKDLREANGLTPGEKIAPGTVIKIPEKRSK
jgi:LysM repeat protein